MTNQLKTTVDQLLPALTELSQAAAGLNDPEVLAALNAEVALMTAFIDRVNQLKLDVTASKKRRKTAQFARALLETAATDYASVKMVAGLAADQSAEVDSLVQDIRKSLENGNDLVTRFGGGA